MNVIKAAKAAGILPERDETFGRVYEVEEPQLERFAQVIRNQALEDAANGSSALAKKWWARHCETNKHMETTREAHEDFCQLERAIRSMKKEHP